MTTTKTAQRWEQTDHDRMIGDMLATIEASTMEVPDRAKRPWKTSTASQTAVPRIDIDAAALALSKRLDGVQASDLARILATSVRKSPPGEGQDVIQAVIVEWLRDQPITGALANVIARTTLCNYWERWRIRQHYGLDSVVDTPETFRHMAAAIQPEEWETALPSDLQEARIAEREKAREKLEKRATTSTMASIQDAMVSGVDWTLTSDVRIDCAQILAQIPERIRQIVQQRLDGYRLGNADRVFLHRWLQSPDAKATMAVMMQG